MASVSENSKSFRSPSTITFALASSARMLSTKLFTTCACWCRCVSVTRFGGWNRPNSGSSPPFELKWLAIAKIVSPRQMNSPASGLRLLANAGLVGSTRPGLNVSCGPSEPATTPVAAVEVPPGRSTNERPRSVRKMKPTRMFPPGSPPSALFTGLICR